MGIGQPNELPDLSQFAIKPKKDVDGESVARVLDDEFAKLGYNDNARLSLLGDIGRENNWNRQTIFGGHADPANKAFNRGIISWQGARRDNLDNFLKKEGVFGKGDDDELRGMARFLDHELQSDKEFQPLHEKIKNAKSTYDASENLRKYIKYVPDGGYNSADPEFRVKNNADWARKAKKAGLAQLPDLTDFAVESALPDLSQFNVTNPPRTATAAEALAPGMQAEPDPEYIAENFGQASPRTVPTEFIPEKPAALPTMQDDSTSSPPSAGTTKLPIEIKGEVSTDVPEGYQVEAPQAEPPPSALQAEVQTKSAIARPAPRKQGEATLANLRRRVSGEKFEAKKYDTKPTPEQVVEDSVKHVYGDDIQKISDVYKQVSGRDLFEGLVTQATVDEGYDKKSKTYNIGGDIYPYAQEIADAYRANGVDGVKEVYEAYHPKAELSTPEDIQNRQIKEIANPSDEQVREAVTKDKTPLSMLGTDGLTSAVLTGYNWLTNRDGKVTDEDIKKYREELPDEEQVRQAFEGTKNFNKLLGHNATGLLGGLGGGAGRLLDAVNGVTKLAGMGFLNDSMKYMTGGKFDINKAMRTPGQDLALIQGISRQGDDSYMMDLGQGIAGAAFDVPRFVLISKIPGLSGAVGTFGADSFLQSLGKDSSLRKNIEEGGKGALLGAVFSGAGKLGEAAGKAISRVAPEILATAVKEGTTLATIAGGTYAAEKGMGAKDDEAMRAAVGLSAFHLVNKFPEAVGKVIKYVKGKNEITAMVTPEGEVKQVKLPQDAAPDGVIDITKVSAPGTKTESDVATTAKSEPTEKSKNVTDQFVDTNKKITAEAPDVNVKRAIMEPEQGKSKVGRSIETKAIEKELTDTFGETAGYDKITVKDQAEKVARLLEDTDRVQKIISGEETLPEDVRGGAFITGVEKDALARGDGETLAKLANSKLTSDTSKAAQEMRLLAERAPDSAVVQMRALKTAREAAAQKRLPKNQTLKDVVKAETESIKTEMKKNAPKKDAWKKFLEEIVCK